MRKIRPKLVLVAVLVLIVEKTKYDDAEFSSDQRSLSLGRRNAA